MLLFPAAFLGGVLVGLLFGGELKGLGQFTPRRGWLIVVSFAIQVLVAIAGFAFEQSWIGYGALAISYLTGGLWVAFNLRGRRRSVQCGLGLMGLGWILNALVVLVNGGMPVSSAALRGIGVDPTKALLSGGPFAKHAPLNGSTVLGTFGDVVPLAWLRSVVSPGDLIMLVGIVLFVAAVMRDAAAQSPDSLHDVVRRSSCDRMRPGRTD